MVEKHFRREDAMTRIWAALIATLWVGAASAQEVKQEFKPDPVDEAAAKREGKVTWYTSTPVAAGQYIANEFEKRTGIKVEMLRTGGPNVRRRFPHEAADGRIAGGDLPISTNQAANAMTPRG